MAHTASLATSVLGNPHSRSPSCVKLGHPGRSPSADRGSSGRPSSRSPFFFDLSRSIQSSHHALEARISLLRFLGADPAIYTVVWRVSSPAACRSLCRLPSAVALTPLTLPLIAPPPAQDPERFDCGQDRGRGLSLAARAGTHPRAGLAQSVPCLSPLSFICSLASSMQTAATACVNLRWRRERLSATLRVTSERRASLQARLRSVRLFASVNLLLTMCSSSQAALREQASSCPAGSVPGLFVLTGASLSVLTRPLAELTRSYLSRSRRSIQRDGSESSSLAPRSRSAAWLSHPPRRRRPHLFLAPSAL